MTKIGKSKSKYQQWLTNFFILIITVVLMLALGEVVLRWIDGYQLSSLELRQDDTTIQSLDEIK